MKANDRGYPYKKGRKIISFIQSKKHLIGCFFGCMKLSGVGLKVGNEGKENKYIDI